MSTTKNWPGPQFYGFNRKDVSKVLNTACSKKRNHISLKSDKQTQEEVTTPQLSDYHLKEKCSWLRVQSFGEIVTGEFSSFYEREHNGVFYLLRDGYVAYHGVKTKAGNHVLVKCKVAANGTLPLFICEAEDHYIETENVGTTVRMILVRTFSVFIVKRFLML